MSELDELIALRPLVSDLRHANAHLRRKLDEAEQIIQAKEYIISGLKASLVALRELQNRTPPLGTRVGIDDHG